MNSKIGDKFHFKKQLIHLLSENTYVLLDEFPNLVEIQNIEKLNKELQDETNFRSDDMMNINNSVFILKNIEKLLIPEDSSYYLNALDSMEIISYNRNFQIDFKELFIYEKTNRYNSLNLISKIFLILRVKL